MVYALFSYIVFVCARMIIPSFVTFSFLRIEFYDELSKLESSVDAGSSGEGEGEREADEPPQIADFSIKALQLSGLVVELGNEQVQDIKLSQNLNGTS